MAKAKRPLRVLLADDNRDILEAVKTMIGHDYEVVSSVHDGLQLVKAEAFLHPDIGIVDISMPVMNGITAAGEIAKRGSTMKVIFLTVNEDCDYIRAAFECGGVGYVIKRRMAADLPAALEEASAGRRYLSPGCVEMSDMAEFKGLDD
jgi:DNA-binding NarL/FixJ family response regulator